MKFEYLEDGDGLDEISGVSKGLSVDERLGVPPKKYRLRSKADGSWPVTDRPIKKLIDKRWKDRHLGGCQCDRCRKSKVAQARRPDELRDVLRRIRAGDKQAEALLIRTHHGALLKVASSVSYGGPEFEDRLAAACEGLLKAARGYDPRANNGLWAYALPAMRHELADCVLGWRRQGGKLETVEDRKARTEAAGFRPIYASYNVSEERDSDNWEGRWGAKASGWIAADDREIRETDGSGGKVTGAHWQKIVDGRAVPTSYPNRRGTPTPCKPITRERYAEDQARAYRFDTAARIKQRLGIDAAPRNGGRVQVHSVFTKLEPHSERAKVRFKDGKYRTVVRQKAATHSTTTRTPVKLRVIKGLQNGRFSHPGTIDHAVHGDIVRRDHGSSERDVRQRYRATNQSSY